MKLAALLVLAALAVFLLRYYRPTAIEIGLFDEPWGDV